MGVQKDPLLRHDNQDQQRVEAGMVQGHVEEQRSFQDVIWFDESTIQLESHRAQSYHKKKQPAPLKARPKHPPKLHVWAGISPRGATPIIKFTGVMTAARYTDILEVGLVPFTQKHFPGGHRFQQDNDPKHSSKYARSYYS